MRKQMRWLFAIPMLALVNFAHAFADNLAGQIRAAQSAGDYRKAAQLYQQLIADGTDSPEVRSNLGMMLHLAGSNQEAMDQFRIALRQKPALVSANLFAGLTEVDLGAPKEALPLLKKAQQLDPRSPAPLLGLGKTYVALRDYGLANESYLKATQLDPRLAEAWYGVGITDRSLAEQRLNKAARAGPSVDQQALQEAVKDLLDRALEALKRAIELDPTSARPHLILAESFSEAGRLVDAIPEFEAAIKQDSKLDAAYLGLATAYWRQGQFQDALPPLKRVLASSPRDPEANAMLADILEHDGQDTAAKQHAGIALAGNPDLMQAHVVLGRVYLTEKQPKLAITELRKVLAADPDGSYHFLLFRAYKEAGDEKSAKIALADFQRLRHKDGKP
jgi:tetratricopeptide (TPR) repeat protein